MDLLYCLLGGLVLLAWGYYLLPLVLYQCARMITLGVLQGRARHRRLTGVGEPKTMSQDHGVSDE